MTIGTIKSIAFRITSKLATHPLFNQYFQNVEDFISLTGFESDELENLFEQPEDKVFNHFEMVGERLYDQYQPPFVDVAKIIDFAATEISKLIRKQQMTSELDRLNKLTQVIQNAIAKAYYYRSLDAVRLLVSQSSQNPYSPLTLHLHWLEEIVAYFTAQSESMPETNHLECHFAHWMGRMEFELLLQSTENNKDAQHARIYLSHRKMHQEFTYIASFVRNKEYILALSHWSLLYQSVLELRQNIQNLQLHYKNHEEKYFFDYVAQKSEIDEELYYFLSIRLAKWAFYEDKKYRLDELNSKILECIFDAGLDGVLHTNESEICILLQNSNANSEIDIPDFLEHQLHELLKKLAKEAGMKSRAIAINLNSLNSYSEQKITMLRQLSFFETKNNFELISPQQAEILYRSAIEAESVAEFASKALDNGTLEVFFQPIIGLQKGKKISVEALVRAPTNDGYLAAEAFLRYLENQKRMTALDHFVIQKIANYANELSSVIDSLSINIYPTSFQHDEIIHALISLSKKLKQYDISLIVEITEQLFMGDTSPVESLALDHNIAFSLDDFGSGYSNLIQLIGLAERGVVKVLKIDGSLVRLIDQDHKVFEVIKTITIIANTLGITPIVMEYVESELILNKLQCLNAKMFFQGYFFDRPLQIDTLIEKYREIPVDKCQNT
jgi:EAL domain-containing protein (putative c-di-GMP-specific phosphodiesterase class I)